MLPMFVLIVDVIAKDIKLYVKPEDNKCYYVADEKITGDVELF